MNFETKLIHAGITPDPSTGAIMTPIYQTSTYIQRSPGDHFGHEYARTSNPTRTVLEKNLTALENGVDAACFSSGLAAMDAVIKLLNPGDEVIASSDLYGGSYRLLTTVFGRFGIKSKFIDMTDLSEIRASISPDTKLLWIETPTNPTLQIVDIESAAQIAGEKKVLTLVDNTFSSPFLQQPLELGADLVLHSATKYLGGHSDLVLGVVITSNKEIGEELHYIQNATGAIPGPMDCFLTLRGIKTLHLRMQRSTDNARKIAEFLTERDEVDRIYYPGLSTHPGHELAKKQMKDFGGMVSFTLKDDSAESANKILSSTEYFLLAESLGGVESLIGHPASMTHGSIPKEKRYEVGLTDSLIRLSVGVENVEDLIEDLRKAFEK